MRDLKCVYKAPNEEVALSSLDTVKDKWNHKYGIVVESLYNNHTTNALERFNRQFSF